MNSLLINLVKTHVSAFFEAAIILVLIAGLVVFLELSFPVLLALDWTQTSAFDELISRALLALIAIEAIQIIRTHRLRDVFLICVFVVARKAVDPMNSGLEIFFLSGALTLLVAAWAFLYKYCNTGLREPV